LNSKKIIEAVAEALTEENEMFTERITVDLKKPDYVLIVSVFKSVAAYSLLPDYYIRYKKYNIISFIDSLVKQSDLEKDK
jgi:tRNA(Ser,Leu) C12 N-acetylase TAN1